MVKSQLQHEYPIYHLVAAVMPIANNVQNPGYQPQFSQDQQQYQPQPQQQVLQQLNPQKQAPRTKFDPIPVNYAELLPILLERNWVQTKAPPPIPKKLPTRFRADLSCVFHQGAPEHDIEGCFDFKNVVQDLIEANLLPF